MVDKYKCFYHQPLRWGTTTKKKVLQHDIANSIVLKHQLATISSGKCLEGFVCLLGS